MANELEKTIEELEAEVLSELEEQSADAPKKGAAPAEPALKASDASSVKPSIDSTLSSSSFRYFISDISRAVDMRPLSGR